jgi:hypothetical protein
MNLLLLAAAVPLILSDKGPEDLVKLPAPGVQLVTRGEGTASATTAPWVNTNGSRLIREPGNKYLYETTRDNALIAAAEGFTFGAQTYLRIHADDQKPVENLLSFFKSIGDAATLKPATNIAVIDNGSPLLPEVLNLLTRRNLLYRVVAAPDPSADLNVQIGSPEFPAALAQNPSAFADEVRKKLTDRKRLMRIYGSEVVLGRLLIGTERARVQLLNYTTQRVESVRVRLRGSYEITRFAVYGIDGAAAADVVVSSGSTEFTVPSMGVTAIIDLKATTRPD